MPESYLPANTQAVLKLEQWSQALEDFKQHAVYSKLNGEIFSDFFESYSELGEALNPNGQVLLAYSKELDSLQNYTLIARTKDLGFIPDSIKGLRKDSMTNTTEIRKYFLGELVFYSSEIDSVSLISTSSNVLSEIQKRAVLKDENFLSALKVKKGKSMSYAAKLPAKASKDSIDSWAGYTTYELQLLPDGIISHGVLMDQDTLGQRLSIFRGQIPQKSMAPSVTLSSAKRALSIGFSNVDSLRSRLLKLHADSLSIHPLFETGNEVVWVKTASTSYVAMGSLDSDLSWENIAPMISEIDAYRDISLFQLSENNRLFEPFHLFFPSNDYRVVFQWKDFLVFTHNRSQAEELISGLLNKSVLSETGYYQNSASYLAQSASLVFYELDGKWSGLTAQLVGSENSILKGYPLIVTQLIYDRDFAHLNMIAKSSSGESISTGPVQQLASVKLENDLLIPPKFFTNHNTGGKDIVVQDIANQLYLISTNGKVLWKKRLDGPILGKVHEVDILRNGKKQLAFSTSKAVYILDRNGNPVAPFPKRFKDPITQPLAIFDYDNNRKYRFVVVQDEYVYMYDSKGQSVKGFTFNKAGSKIVMPPQHIRIGRKDYITIAEASGKLNILSRVGKIRVPVNRNIAFGEIPIEKEGVNFVVISEDKQKISIDQKGGISPQQLDVSDTYWFTIYGNTKLTLDDNLMRINGKLTELPVGLFSIPQLLPFGKNLFATITETKENLIYLYSKAGRLLPNFPIYGTSEIDLADANRNNSMNIVVKGESNEVILYQLPKQ